MIEDTELTIQEAKELIDSTNVVKSRNIVAEVENDTLDTIKNGEEFKQTTTALYHKKSLADYRKKELEIENVELKNKYDEYVLKKNKELLDYQIKYEKGLVKETARANIQVQKLDIALKRYGYLYPLLDENGVAKTDYNNNVIVDMSKFTPNKLNNRFKEFETNYSKLNKTTRKAIWATLKTVLILGTITISGYLLYVLAKWLMPLIAV